MSSLPVDSPVRAYIETSLRLLQAEFPAAYYLMCARLAGLETHLTIDDESIPLVFTPQRVTALPAPVQPAVQLTTRVPTILDVIDARLSLQDAILADAILLAGEVVTLQRFHDALLLYLHGAVRSPSFPELLRRFRQRATSSR